MTTVSDLEVVLRGDDGNLTRSLDRADSRLMGFARGANRRLGELTRSLATVGITTAVGIGGAALAASTQWESAFADVRKTVDGTDEELAELEAVLRDMATTGATGALRDAHTELAGIAALGGQLGIATDELDEFTEVIAALTVATNLSADEAATFFAQFGNVTGLPVDQYDEFADVLVTLGNNMATTEKDIATFASRMASLSTFDFAPEEIAAYGAAMASLGLTPELGSTNFIKTVTDINNAVSQGGPELRAYAEAAGMTVDEFTDLANSDGPAALNEFLEGLASMDVSDQLATLRELGITGQEQQRTVLTLAEGYETVVQSLDLANKAFEGNNAAMDEAAKKADTTGGKINLLKNNFGDLAISLGQVLDGGFNTVLDGLLRLTDGDIGGVGEIALGFVEMAEALVELTGIEVNWADNFEEGIEVFGRLQQAIAGTGPYAEALRVILDNIKRDFERFTLDMLNGVNTWLQGFNDLVYNATGGSVHLMPELTFDRTEFSNRIAQLDVADTITDVLQQQMRAGDIDIMSELFNQTVDTGSMNILVGNMFRNSVQAENIAAGMGEEGRIAIEEALRMAIGEGDQEAIDVLTPIAMQLDIDPDDLVVQTQDLTSDAIASAYYDAVAMMNITMVPNNIDMTQVNAAVAAASVGLGVGTAGGGTVNYINSYGENSAELVERVNRAQRDFGG